MSVRKVPESARRYDVGLIRRGPQSAWIPSEDIIDSSLILSHVSKAGKEERVGTAFLVRVPFENDDSYEHIYIVTAAHCVMDSHFVPRSMWAEGNWMGGQGSAKSRLSAEGWSILKYQDLADPAERVDLALRRYTGPAYTGHLIGRTTRAIRIDQLIDVRRTDFDDAAPLGLETATVGLLLNYRESARAEPAVRFGRLSLVPFESVPTVGGQRDVVYLVESNATHGMSGAPVLVKDDGDEREFALLGVHVGHYLETDGREVTMSHSGLSRVVPAPFIIDLLSTDEVVTERERVEARHAELPWRMKDRRHRERNGVVFAEELFINEDFYLDEYPLKPEVLLVVTDPPNSKVQDWWNVGDVGDLGSSSEVAHTLEKWTGRLTWWRAGESGYGSSPAGPFEFEMYLNAKGGVTALNLTFEDESPDITDKHEDVVRAIADCLGAYAIAPRTGERIA